MHFFILSCGTSETKVIYTFCREGSTTRPPDPAGALQLYTTYELKPLEERRPRTDAGAVTRAASHRGGNVCE